MESPIENFNANDKFFEAKFPFVKVLQKLTGLWPYEIPRKALVFRIVSFSTVFLYMTPMFSGVRTYYGTGARIFMECIAEIIYVLLILSKYVHIICIHNKILRIYNDIATSWSSVNVSGERNILEDYSRQGKTISLIYSGYVIFGTIVFHTMPIALGLYTSMFASNISRNDIMAIRGDYIVDLNVYFYPINIIYIFLAAILATIILSVDIPFIMIIHQCLASFKIVNYRIKESSQIYDNVNTGKEVKNAIKTHQNVLQIVDNIQNAFSLLFLELISVTIGLLSIGIVWILNETDYGVVIKYSLVAVGLVMHLFSLSWPGQQIIDHSSDIFDGTYDCSWYHFSKPNRNLIRFMMMRSIKPSILTASGLYVMNYENFGTVLKTTASYITVIKSMTE